MNPKLLLFLFIIAGFTSCTTAYKLGQTPDDVYYSPAPAYNDYVKQDNSQDKNVYTSSYDDVEISNHIYNRRWRIYDDYDYGYYYPDYYYPIYVNPKYGSYNYKNIYTGPRKYNLGSYNPNTYNTTAGKNMQTNGNAPVRTFTTQSTNNNSGVGNFIRKVFSGGNNTSTTKSTTDDSNPTRTFNNSRSTNNNSSSTNSSGSRSSSSSGGNAPVRKF